MTETVAYEQLVAESVMDAVHGGGVIRTEQFAPALKLSFSVTAEEVTVWRGHRDGLDDAGLMKQKPRPTRPLLSDDKELGMRRIKRKDDDNNRWGIKNLRPGPTLTAEQVAALVDIVTLNEQAKQAKVGAVRLFST
jgi:hypothetical protein